MGSRVSGPAGTGLGATIARASPIGTPDGCDTTTAARVASATRTRWCRTWHSEHPDEPQRQATITDKPDHVTVSAATVRRIARLGRCQVESCGVVYDPAASLRPSCRRGSGLSNAEHGSRCRTSGIVSARRRSHPRAPARRYGSLPPLAWQGKVEKVTDNDRLVFMRWFENHDDADGQWPCIRSRPLSR